MTQQDDKVAKSNEKIREFLCGQCDCVTIGHVKRSHKSLPGIKEVLRHW